MAFRVLLLLPPLLAAGPAENHVQRWRADLEAFARHLEAAHPAPFARLPRTAFWARIRDLEAALPTLSDAQVAARWSALVADLGDAHTDVDLERELEDLGLPIRLQRFSDGTHIVAATRPLVRLLGARVVEVEGLPLERLYEGLKPFVPFRQEGWFSHLFEASFHTWPRLMVAAGLLPLRERWRIRVQEAQGGEATVDLGLAPTPALRKADWVEESGPPATEGPYQHRILQREGCLVLTLEAFQESPRRPFRAFLAEALATASRAGARRMVVDLRGNTGGREAMVDKLLEALRRARGFKGGIFVLTDGAVFSAAAVAAWRLREEAAATLVGEACGAEANHVGAVRHVHLPSGRKLRFGTELHIIDRAHPQDLQTPIRPDIEVRTSHVDWARGRDPVMEAALGGPDPK